MFLLIFNCSWVAAAEPELQGETAALIDAKTGRLLYGKDAHKRMYPASTTKVLTALVALERANLSDVVTVGPNAINSGGTRIWLPEGEQLTLEELLFALMLNSANDAGVAIAEHVAGSVESFAQISNLAAKKIGAVDTHFTNPHGMPEENHYSTAYDLALIGRKAMENEDFRRIVSTVHHEIPRSDPEAQKYLFNHNKLLWSTVYGYKGATGLKTGYTSQAGQCIIASAKRDDRELIAVVLRTEGVNLWSDAAKLLDYGFDNYENQQLIEKDKVMTSLPVIYGKENVKLVAGEDYIYTFTRENPEDLQISFDVPESTLAPVDKGEVLGAIVISKGQEEIARINLMSDHQVDRDYLAIIKSALYWVLPIVLLLLWLKWRIGVALRRRRRLARRKKYEEASRYNDIDTY
ncbi:D-alanyl-D-alanine carboxypeptidase [Desulforamulus aquiferis]|uniref:serine-type D-Ala-D-Ala carboxypeptidase n=1 Tax=Desulforamulus aquiferis TaxID=1397668 RepID=A0AAW7ZFS3_9FIRM|nr:D-alanyl-D-alanine carboxypeptidase [Desulforamulus aquiferis]